MKGGGFTKGRSYRKQVHEHAAEHTSAARLAKGDQMLTTPLVTGLSRRRMREARRSTATVSAVKAASQRPASQWGYNGDNFSAAD